MHGTPKVKKTLMSNNKILEATRSYADEINTPINTVLKVKMLIEGWQWRGGEGRKDMLHCFRSQVIFCDFFSRLGKILMKGLWSWKTSFSEKCFELLYSF